MTYVKVLYGEVKVYPYTTLFTDNPSVSFPSPLTDDILAEFDVYPVEPTEKPSCLWWQDVYELEPVFENGVWRQQWEVVVRPTSDRDQIIENEWKNVREKRNELLSKSDWTQLADSPVDKTVWAEYRQALRDLPSTNDNPFEIVWPVEPT